MTIFMVLLFAAAGIAAAQEAGPGQETSFFEERPAPVIAPDANLTFLIRGYTSSWQARDKNIYLQRIGTTKPKDINDLRTMLHLYSKEDYAARTELQRSIGLMSPADRDLSEFFVSVLNYDDARLRLFGLFGAERTRDPRALPTLRALADKKLPSANPASAANPKSANEWILQFHALRALAGWKGEKIEPLLLKRALEAPPVAAIVAEHFWEEAYDRIVRWSESRKKRQQEAAAEAWKTAVPVETLRATLPRLWKTLLDRRKRYGTRHQAARKLGFAAAEPDVDRLLTSRGTAADDKERTLYDAALFASRHPKAVPILIEYVKTHEEPLSRAGALVQLGGMMSAPDYKELLSWVGANDSDPENREIALKQLNKN